MKNRKGAAFLIVVVLSAFILLLAGLFAILGQADYKNQAENAAVDKALAVAEKGLAALTNPLTPYTYDFVTKTGSFVTTEPVKVDNQSFYWTKAYPLTHFFVDGFPDPDPANLPDPSNYIAYDRFTVYSVGVITIGSVANLGASALEALVEALVKGTSTQGIITSTQGIIVSSVRVFSSTVVEKETYPGAKAYDSATSYLGDGTETVTYGGKAYTCEVPYPSVLPTGGILPTDGSYWSLPLVPTLTFVPNDTANLPEISTSYLPGKADWKEIDLETFLKEWGVEEVEERHLFEANVSGTITIAAGAGGSVAPLTTTLTYTGGAVAITATPAAGYHFDNWAVTVNPFYISITNTGAALTSIAATSHMPEGGVGTVTATFAANVSGTITIAAGANGTVTPTTTTLTYNEAGKPITARANAGYHFVNWTGTGNAAYVLIAGPSSGATTLTATSNMPDGGTATVQATFAANVSGTITIAAGANGTVTPITTTLTYAESAVAITATPNAGYAFVSWAVTSNATYVNLTNASTAGTIITATSNMPQGGTATVTATFAANVSGVITIAASTGGEVLPVSTTGLTYLGSAVTITTTPNGGYHFVNWAVTSNATYISLANANLAVTTISATSSMPQAGTATVTATFAVNVSGTITIAAGDNGTVAPTSTALTYTGSAVAITATAEAGYSFVSWVVTDNPSYVNITSSGTAATTISATNSMPQGGGATVTATFAANVSGVITIAASTGGSVTPTTTTLTYAGGEEAITATAGAGYHFVSWAVTSNATYISLANANLAATTLTATSSMPEGGTATVTATFTVNVSGTITVAAGTGGSVAPTATTLTYKGTPVAITATSWAGYHFVSWAGTSNAIYVSLANASAAATTLTAASSMPDGGKATVTATFAPNVSGAITIAARANGSVTPLSTTLTYAGGEETITATSNAGYHFVNWAVTNNATYVNVANANLAATTLTATNSIPEGGTATVTATFAVNVSGTITVAAGTGGSVAPTATTLTYKGTPVAITATSWAGYHFVSWAGTSNANYVSLANANLAVTTISATSSMPQADTATVTATFAANVSGLITIAAGANGTVTPTTTTLTYNGSAVAIAATPAANYHFVSWAVTSNIAYVNITNADVAATTLMATSSMPEGDTATVTASFAIDTYTITASTGSFGTVTPMGVTTKNYGDTQAYEIQPSTGYRISSLTVDGNSVVATSPYTFTALAANHTIRATFVINTYTITASAGSNGTVTPSGVTTKNYWENQTYVITPATGYNIASLTVDGKPAIIATTYTFANITIEHTISAIFITAFTITASAGSNGTITPLGVTTKNSGDTQSYVITPSTGYRISLLTVDGNAVAATSPYTFSAIAANHIINATFANTFTITASAAGGGTITPAGIILKNPGDTQAYIITPTDGYQIASVTVDGSAVAATSPYTFTAIAANHTISATFALSVSGAITIVAGTGGSVAPTSVILHGSAVTITATPSTGYSFVRWTASVNPSYISIANSGAAATTITATNNMPQGGTATVTATFASSAYTIGMSYGGGYIAYIDGTGLHGLIVSAADLSAGAAWASGVSLCQNYRGGGYSDWYLPGYAELNELSGYVQSYGSFATGTYDYYWSSTIDPVSGNPYVVHFPDGQGYHATSYYDICYIRAVRSF